MVTIRFSDYGDFLATRALGNQLALDIKAQLLHSPKVIFDFTGVQSVSLSFSDELMKDLINYYGFEHLKSITHFTNLSDAIAQTFKVAISMRKDSVVN